MADSSASLAARGTLPAPSADVGTVRAWDLPTRIFHWALVLAIAGGYISRYYGDSDFVWHKWNGYGVLTLIVFRVIWGFVGGSTARFRAFFPMPRSALGYARDLVLNRPRHFLGHNPLGAAMVLALMMAVLAQGLTGLFNSDDVLFDGPLVKMVSEAAVKRAGVLHHYIFEILLVLIALHVAANLFYLLVKREPLIQAMFSGRKPAATYEDAVEFKGGSVGLALLCLAIAAAIVLGTVRLFGGAL